MPGPRACDPPVVLHADEEPSRAVARPVGETHNSLDQLSVRKRSGLFAFELDVDRLAPGDQLAERFRRHGFRSRGACSSRTCIGWVIASTDR